MLFQLVFRNTINNTILQTVKCNNCQGKSDIKYKNYKKEIPTEETNYDWPMVDKPCTLQ